MAIAPLVAVSNKAFVELGKAEVSVGLSVIPFSDASAKKRYVRQREPIAHVLVGREAMHYLVDVVLRQAVFEVHIVGHLRDHDGDDECGVHLSSRLLQFEYLWFFGEVHHLVNAANRHRRPAGHYHTLRHIY